MFFKIIIILKMEMILKKILIEDVRIFLEIWSIVFGNLVILFCNNFDRYRKLYFIKVTAPVFNRQ